MPKYCEIDGVEARLRASAGLTPQVRCADLTLAKTVRLTRTCSPTKPPASPSSLIPWATFTCPSLSPVGVPKVLGSWLTPHLSEVVVLEVREPDEFCGELGHIAGAAAKPTLALGVSASQETNDYRGHGVCGISRLSVRSIVATATVMLTGFATLRDGFTERECPRGPEQRAVRAPARGGRNELTPTPRSISPRNFRSAGRRAQLLR